MDDNIALSVYRNTQRWVYEGERRDKSEVARKYGVKATETEE